MREGEREGGRGGRERGREGKERGREGGFIIFVSAVKWFFNGSVDYTNLFLIVSCKGVAGNVADVDDDVARVLFSLVLS